MTFITPPPLGPAAGFFRPWVITYVATIVVANLMLLWLPTVVIFGAIIPPAIFASGFVFVLRDFAQKEVGHYVLVAIVVAAILTYFLAGPEIAAASATAFLVAELLDYLVYTTLHFRLSTRVALSSLVSVPVDTAVFFLALGIRDSRSFFIGTGIKLVATAVFWIYLACRERGEDL